MTNDQLVSINGMSLLGKANPFAMETLRKAMHEEGPVPGIISLTVARKKLDDLQQPLSRTSNNLARRDSLSSLPTSSGKYNYYINFTKFFVCLLFFKNANTYVYIFYNFTKFFEENLKNVQAKKTREKK